MTSLSGLPIKYKMNIIEKLSGQFLNFIVISHWYVKVWIQIRDIFVVLLYHLCSCGESHLFLLWCVCDRCNMADNDKDLGMSRKPGTEDRRWSNTGRILGGWMIGRSSDVVCCLYRAHRDDEHEFFGLTSKPRSSGFLVEPQNWFGP
jgi:hypothetical protein